MSNPNPFELPEPKYTFTYSVYERPLVRRTIQNRQKLAAASTTPIIFGILSYYADVDRVVPEMRMALEYPCTLAMTFDFSIPAFADDKFEQTINAILPRH
jgi:hypothetical protein